MAYWLNLYFLVLTSVLTINSQIQIPQNFIPFGVDQGDRTLARPIDTISSSIPIKIRFPYFNEKYDIIHIYSSGLILFGNRTYVLPHISPGPFPLKDFICVAPYWADTDQTVDPTSDIFYREIDDTSMLRTITEMVKTGFPTLVSHTMLWAYVVTWYKVPPGHGWSTPRNTFQAIITTNGIYSFTIFTYHKLEWSAGAWGGYPQVGFNAGDQQNYYTIEKSFSANIQSIVNDSNIGVRGQFIFHTTGDIGNVECNTIDGLLVSPYRGLTFGGYDFRLYGICFNETSYIVEIDNHIVDACQISLMYIVCTMPMLYDGPTLLIKLYNSNRTLIASTEFIVEIPPDNSVIQSMLLENNKFDGNIININDEDTLILNFKKNSLTLKQRFDIILYYYYAKFDNNNELSNISSTQIELGNNVNLSAIGNFAVNLTSALSLVRVAELKDVSEFISLAFHTLGTEIWRLTLSLVLDRKKLTESTEDCKRWHSEQANPEGYIEQIPTCFCRVPSTGRDPFPNPLPGGTFQIDSGCDFHKDLDKTCAYHQGARGCYRGQQKQRGPGAQCCYDSNGRWINNPKNGGGTLDVQAPTGSLLQILKHHRVDVAPFYWCCKGGGQASELCQLYFEKRPAGKCENEILPIPAGGNGDPHFLTLDGTNYTFNGYGEYVLLNIENILEVQVRLAPIASDELENQATSIVAFVIKNKNYARVQFELFQSLKLVEIRVNNRLIESSIFQTSHNNDDNDDTLSQMLWMMGKTVKFDNDNVAITQLNLTIFKIQYSNQINFIIDIRKQYDFLNIITILSQTLKEKCKGLLGNIDKDQTNDLMFSNGTILTSADINDEHIIFKFGESWRTTSDMSLFYYIANDNHGKHQNLKYRPIFKSELFQKYQNSARLTVARQTCEVLSSTQQKEQCIYDILITNDTTMLELHQDFHTSVDDWKEYAELVEQELKPGSARLSSHFSLITFMLIITQQLLTRLLKSVSSI